MIRHAGLFYLAAFAGTVVLCAAGAPEAPEAKRVRPAGAADVSDVRPVAPAGATEDSNGRYEAVCLCIEPAALKTATSRLLPGSKQTVMSPAVEDEFGVTAMSAAEFAATGLTWDEFFKKACAAAARHLKSLRPEFKRDAKGHAVSAVLKSDRHLTPSVIFCPEFSALFKDSLGDRLVVLMPDRFTLHVFSRSFGDFQSKGPALLRQYEAATWPCSSEAFEITSEAIRCLGGFDDGSNESFPEAPLKQGDKAAQPPSKPSR